MCFKNVINLRFLVNHGKQPRSNKDERAEGDNSDCFRSLSLGQCQQLFSLLTAQDVRDSMSSTDAEYLSANGVAFRGEGDAELDATVERLRNEVRIFWFSWIMSY